MKIAYQLDVLCRLCLSQVGKENIFEPVDMTNDIFTITGVKVVSNDPLPQKICINCIKTIKDGIRLRFVSKKNEKQLKYLLFSETDYNCDGEINISLASQQPQVMSRSNTQEQNTLNNVNASNSEPSNTNEDPNTSNQILKVREDLYNQSMIENNQESRTRDNGDISAIVKEEDEELSGEDQSLLVPIKQQRLSGVEEDQLFSYECEKCLKIFDSRKKLTLHARIHKKKCRCPHEGCDKIFACNNDLYKHIRCHTGEKPYQCDICLRCFTQNGTLRSHKINIHGIVPQSKGTRFKFESGMPSAHYDSVEMPADTNLEEYSPYENEILVTSNTFNESIEGDKSERLPLEVELSPEDSQKARLNGQEQRIVSSINIRLSSEVNNESVEMNHPIESYLQTELSDSSTPKPPTSIPS